jgi:HSP20 family molecular chaperone IbpA
MKKGKEAGMAAGKNEDDLPVRISVEGDRIHVLAELQGIREEHLKIDLDPATLVISADGQSRIMKMVSLPWEARLGQKRFRNGVLELTLERSNL